MGYGDAARRIQDAYLDGRHREAAAQVPFEFLDQTSLLGNRDRIADRLAAYAEAGVTTLSVAPYATDQQSRFQVLRTVADAAHRAGLGG
jgi:alkanesulfonate monooxygenase SsuD/methylene tetrahydromethanopterin reductase-like flavin-dependent oxidoreductase (luciferase family)